MTMRPRTRTGPRGDRRQGALLLEAMIAIAIFTVGVLAFLSTFQSITRVAEDVRNQDSVQFALRNVANEIREADFATFYATFNGTTVVAPGLKDVSGNPATVQITCFVDETALPLQFGPVLDLNGDGVMSSTDCSANYRLLPVRLSLSYATRHGTVTGEEYLVLSGSF